MEPRRAYSPWRVRWMSEGAALFLANNCTIIFIVLVVIIIVIIIVVIIIPFLCLWEYLDILIILILILIPIIVYPYCDCEDIWANLWLQLLPPQSVIIIIINIIIITWPRVDRRALFQLLVGAFVGFPQHLVSARREGEVKLVKWYTNPKQLKTTYIKCLRNKRYRLLLLSNEALPNDHYFLLGKPDTYIDMTQLLLLGKFEYGGGPIFNVVLEC